MNNTELQVFLIASSQIKTNNALSWLKFLGVSSDATFNLIGPHKTDAELIVECAGRRCYKSFQAGLNPNVTKIRTDIREYISNILKSGHGSVLEHVTFTFAIENVSRVFTGEMNRHRAGMAISEGSMRYIRYDDIPYWIPFSIRDSENDTPELRQKKIETRSIFEHAFEDAETHYKHLLDVWSSELAPESQFKAKKDITSMLRRIIPMGVSTGGVWTGNIRAIRHIFGMRISPHAEEEILAIAMMMLALVIEAEPSFFSDFEKREDGFYYPKYPKV